MDKRSILFVLAVGLSFFAINTFFSQQHDEKVALWKEQQLQKQEKEQQESLEELEKRRLSLENLPLIKTYLDKEGKKPSATALDIDGAILYLKGKDDAPSHLYASSEGSSLRRYTLNAPQGSPGTPLLYTFKSSSETKTLSLKSTQTYNIHLATGALTPTVTVATYKEGKLSFFLDPLKDNAFAFVQIDKDLIPVGVYRAADKALVPLESFPYIPTAYTSPQQDQKLTDQKGEETFYVLENKFQQLVFSSYGGALAEINLPLVSKDNKKSIVREIEFDRELKNNNSPNALFPSKPFFAPGAHNVTSKLSRGGYYPLIRRTIYNPATKRMMPTSPQHYACNITSEYPETAELVYDVKEFSDNTIVFESIQPRRRITKTFTLTKSGDGAPYCLDLFVTVESADTSSATPLWMTTGTPEVEMMSGSPTPSLKYRTTRLQKSEVEGMSLPKKGKTTALHSITPDWVCNSNGFLGLIIDPLTPIPSGVRAQEVSGDELPSRLIAIDYEHERFKASGLPGYSMSLPLHQNGKTTHFRIFAGPFAGDTLNAIDSFFEKEDSGYIPDYISCQDYHGWFSFISGPFAKFLLILMKFFHTLTDSWALAIVLLTIALRLMLYPLNAWSMKSMKRMQHVSPLVTAIQAKHKKDPKKAQAEIMELYRGKGVNPMMGCLPMLIQMPFLIGMFDLLKSTFELRGAPFIPGWIDNLTAPDVLFDWGTPVFFIGSELHILPVLLGAAMFIQQRMSASLPKDKSTWTEQQQQQRFMGNIMTVVFTFMFYNLPSGLNIYWLSSMVLGVLQQWIINKSFKGEVIDPTKPQVLPAVKGKKKKR
jgi:YidC/Oxa1 family membrane protein insertase